MMLFIELLSYGNNNISTWRKELLGGLLVLDGVLGLSFLNITYQYLGSPSGILALIDLPRARLELTLYTPQGPSLMADATLTCCCCCYPASMPGWRRGMPLVLLRTCSLTVAGQLRDHWPLVPSLEPLYKSPIAEGLRARTDCIHLMALAAFK